MISENSDTRLTRNATAAALTAAGFPIRAATLATKATRGGGPPFQRFGVAATLSLGRCSELGTIPSEPTDRQHERASLGGLHV